MTLAPKHPRGSLRYYTVSYVDLGVFGTVTYMDIGGLWYYIEDIGLAQSLFEAFPHSPQVPAISRTLARLSPSF